MRATGRSTSSYLVCATPRSGSTLLCEALAETGVAGRPLEFFEAVPETGMPRRPLDYLEGLDDLEALALVEAGPPHTTPWYSDLRGIAHYSEHLARVRGWGSTDNGVFGAKIMWGHLQDVARQVADMRGYRGLDLGALVDELFDSPRLIWVRRDDTVRQAVSLWRAMQTQSWRAENEPSGARCDEPRYSFAALHHLVELLAAHDAAWARFFTETGSDPLSVTYEELSRDLPRVLARALDHLGVAPHATGAEAPPPLRRQSDERSDAWAAAYARDAMLAAR